MADKKKEHIEDVSIEMSIAEIEYHKNKIALKIHGMTTEIAEMQGRY